ncbi:MAG: hypothetical protein KTR21_08430 [Rhodobacteraceae bacterium]|nr:hypothetical protein [Paracoccaceae bacterium]
MVNVSSPERMPTNAWAMIARTTVVAAVKPTVIKTQNACAVDCASGGYMDGHAARPWG